MVIYVKGLFLLWPQSDNKEERSENNNIIQAILILVSVISSIIGGAKIAI